MVLLLTLVIAFICGFLVRPVVEQKLWFLFDKGHKIFGVKNIEATNALLKITGYKPVLKLKTGHTRQFICSNGITFNHLVTDEKNLITGKMLDGTGLSLVVNNPLKAIEDANKILQSYGFKCSIKGSLENNEQGKIYFLYTDAFNWPLVFRYKVTKMPKPITF